MIFINLKMIRALKTKKGRDEQNLFIMENEKFVLEIPSNINIVTYVCSEAWQGRERLTGAPVIVVSEKRFQSLSDTVTPQGIMAVCEKQSYNLEDMQAGSPLILICECLSDPGNIGTLIRTAAAAGAAGVIFSAGSGDVYNSKVIRASAGSLFRIPVTESADLQEVIPILKQKGNKQLH